MMRKERRWRCAALCVGVALVLAACSGSSSPGVPLAEDWPVLRAGQPLLESTSDVVTAIAGAPESASWEAQWSFFCSVSFLGKDTVAKYQGFGSALWRGVSDTSRAALFNGISERWEAEGLSVFRSPVDYKGQSFISADPPGFFVSATHYGATDGDTPRGTFTINILTGCYSWDELRASQANTE